MYQTIQAETFVQSSCQKVKCSHPGTLPCRLFLSTTTIAQVRVFSDRHSRHSCHFTPLAPVVLGRTPASCETSSILVQMMSNVHTRVSSRKVSGAGSGLFTSQAVEPGTEVFHADRPLVSVLNSGQLKTACSSCFLWLPDGGSDGATVVPAVTETAKGKKLKACQACKIVRYCSKVGFGFSERRHHEFFRI